ncbi:type II toxin-antitoxin system PemK/MazF family toxin [Priestia sp. FSL W8-0524]|uniref:type II toxin-antitoxin system PemK/MazF family toxin n=1 Tax=Priestia sp. FSL W8-0524 TaxID=2954625 RepID=UPI0030FB01E2
MPSSNYNSKSDLRDTREFHFGSVWKVDDRDVSIPQIDKLSSTRNVHPERWVVVISNNNENYHPLCPIVTVAPLSHRVDLKRAFDLELSKSNDNVKVDCLLQLKLSQPILKVDLYEEQGEISDDKKVELQVLLEGFYGLSFEDEDEDDEGESL